ncbi:MAG: MFS transporter [Chlamydiae bacterium]|nr:MFS transporter [Chlamydiota bacterium]
MIKRFNLSAINSTLFILWTSHFIMDFFKGIWPIYKTISKMDLAQAGLIAGISGFFGEILQLLFGYFCDQGYRKKILLLGLVLSSSILWITFSNSFFFSLIIVLILMIGSGSFHPAAVGYAGALSSEHKGKNILIFSSGGALGLGISQIVFTKMYYAFNGHTLILFLPIALLFIFILIHKFPEIDTGSLRIHASQLTESLSKHVKPLTLLYFTQVSSYLVGSALLFLLPDVMMAKTANQWLTMGGGHLCFIMGAAFSLPWVGFLCDRLGPKKILPVFILAPLALLYLLLKKSHFSTTEAIALLVFLGGFFQSISPIIISWGHKMMPTIPSTVSAILMGLAWCVTNFGPTCAGLMCKRFEEDAVIQALEWMGLLMVISLFLSLCIKDTIPAEKTSNTAELDPEF